jgi:hypothetical protein
MKRMNRKHRKDQRRAEAEERQKVYDQLSIKARIKVAESRPGASEKEIAKLKKRLNN